MEIGTGLALLGSAKLFEKLLGPTADYFGKEFKNWTEKRINNVRKIFSNATQKLGNDIEINGSVPPKVLKSILIEGSFCDDELSIEYFGGVLASSRSAISRDDRGSYFISLINRLSSYQLRSHYIFYSIIKKLFDCQDFNVNLLNDREKMATHIPFDVFNHAMDFSENENAKVLIPHLMFGLLRENLIGEHILFGSGPYLKKHVNKRLKSGIIFLPSTFGIELFLWANGKGRLATSEFSSKENKFNQLINIEIKSGFRNI